MKKAFDYPSKLFLGWMHGGPELPHPATRQGWPSPLQGVSRGTLTGWYSLSRDLPLYIFLALSLSNSFFLSQVWAVLLFLSRYTSISPSANPSSPWLYFKWNFRKKNMYEWLWCRRCLVMTASSTSWRTSTSRWTRRWPTSISQHFRSLFSVSLYLCMSLCLNLSLFTVYNISSISKLENVYVKLDKKVAKIDPTAIQE